MALTDEQLELLGNQLVPLYQELEQDVIADIARRVKKTGRYTETAELMARALMEQGYSPARIQREVMKVLRADKEYQMAVAEHTKEYKQYVAGEISRVVAEAKEQGNSVVAEAGNMAFNADLSLWEQAGKSLSRPSGFRQLVDAMAVQTSGELKNLTKSLGFKNVGFTALENVYQYQLDLGLIKLTSGAYSWQRVVDDCVRELAQSGLRTIDYKSGRSMQLDTAVRNCIRTASSQLAGKVTMLNMDSTGESLVEVSQHWGTRSDGSCGHSDHAYWPGKVYTIDRGAHGAESRRLGYPIRNLEDATGYPSDPLGLCGYNCRHTFYVFFEGVSEPNQWEPEPEPVMVNGREYDYYHAMQRQRQMERQIRATKREIEAQKALGGDTKELQSRLRKQTADYKRFSADVDIRPKNERLRVQAGSSNLKYNGGKKTANNIIIHSDGTYNKGAIQMIENIERKNNEKGNANAITHFGTGLNKRQTYLLEQLSGYDSRCVVSKKNVKLSDLSALTAQTGVEFAMFTKGSERLIIRGDERSVNVSKSYALELKLLGYRWSGHTHPGIDDFCLMPSSGDKEILSIFSQDCTAIYNSTGKWYVLEKEVY
ncbi:MAG: phage minor capsid protein [Roseburia hominis]